MHKPVTTCFGTSYKKKEVNNLYNLVSDILKGMISTGWIDIDKCCSSWFVSNEAMDKCLCH